jgi:hypothetical protein
MRQPEDPHNRRQWQETVDQAAGWRTAAEAGLVQSLSRPVAVDVVRCTELLERGARFGVYPSRPHRELAIEVLFDHEVTFEAQRRGLC